MTIMIFSIKTRRTIAALVCAAALFSANQYADAAEQFDIDAEIKAQEEALANLRDNRAAQDQQALRDRLDQLEGTLSAIRSKASYDAQGAIDALAAQINDIRMELDSTAAVQQQILSTLEKLEARLDTQPAAPASSVSTGGDEAEPVPRVRMGRAPASSNYLVNPGPGSGSEVSYTQDAINSQGNSTMTFVYSPDQLYKIYCRRGYLTDLAFKKGEKITFVGGGDTAGWAVSTAEIDGTPHLYVKPVVESSTTNLIVATDKHSYQLILNTSEWYNPMVKWVYDAETQETNLLRQEKDARITTGNLNITNVDDLDFNYDVSGGSEGDRPVMVFSDGAQTYIKFKRARAKQVPLFVRERGKKEMALVSYRIKDEYYIVEKVFEVAQLKFSDETVTIRHK